MSLIYRESNFAWYHTLFFISRTPRRSTFELIPEAMQHVFLHHLKAPASLTEKVSSAFQFNDISLTSLLTSCSCSLFSLIDIQNLSLLTVCKLYLSEDKWTLIKYIAWRLLKSKLYRLCRKSHLLLCLEGPRQMDLRNDILWMRA